MQKNGTGLWKGKETLMGSYRIESDWRQSRQTEKRGSRRSVSSEVNLLAVIKSIYIYSQNYMRKKRIARIVIRIIDKKNDENSASTHSQSVLLNVIGFPKAQKHTVRLENIAGQQLESTDCRKVFEVETARG